MKKPPIVGRGDHTDEHAAGFYVPGGHVRHWGKFGAFWGGLFGIVFPPALFFAA